MLILGRRKDEAFTLHTSDGVITVKVVEMHQGNVWLGVDAPKSVAIQRDDMVAYKVTTAPEDTSPKPALVAGRSSAASDSRVRGT